MDETDVINMPQVDAGLNDPVCGGPAEAVTVLLGKTNKQKSTYKLEGGGISNQVTSSSPLCLSVFCPTTHVQRAVLGSANQNHEVQLQIGSGLAGVFPEWVGVNCSSPEGEGRQERMWKRESSPSVVWFCLRID